MPRPRREAKGLDRIDADIIGLLQNDSRRPNTEIARHLGVAETTVRNRIDRLVRDGIMQCGVWTDPLKIGYQTYAIVQIQVDPPRLEQVADELARYPEVFFLGVTTGAFDVVAAAVFRSNEHLYELMTKRLARVGGIQRTSTLGIVRIVKRAYAYPVPPVGSDEPAPRRSARARSAVPARPAVPARSAVPARPAVPARSAVPARPAASARSAVPARPAASARSAVPPRSPARPRSARAGARTAS